MSLNNLVSSKSKEKKESNQQDALFPFLKKLEKINNDLKQFREKIKEEKINNYTVKGLKQEFDKYINEYDKTKDIDMLFIIKSSDIEDTSISVQILIISLEIQAFINRIAHKINNYDNKNLKESYANMLNESDKIKESVITISSLVFTAFTFIQLNFVAFQNSKDYTVLDRIILFSGINLFVIIGIYSILTMIKSLLNISPNNTKNNNVIIVIFIIFTIIFSGSLLIKCFFGPNPEIKKLEKKIINKNNEILNLNQRILEFNIKFNELSQLQIKLNEKENKINSQISNFKIYLEKSKNKNNNQLLEIEKAQLNLDKKIFYFLNQN